MQRTYLLEKNPDAGKDWRQKEKKATEDERLSGITSSMGMNMGKVQEMVRDREARSAAVHVVMKSQTWLGDWTTMNNYHLLCLDERT